MRYIRQVAVFIVLVIVCGFLLYSAYTDIETKTIAQINNEQMVHAGQAAAGIENFFSAYNDSLSFLAGNEHIITLDSDGRDLMRDFFTSHGGEISSITRVDENGIIAYTYPVETSTGADISSQSHVREVMSTHSVVISDVFTSVQGFRTVALHIPVFQDGRFRGSIAVLIPFDALAKENLGTIRIIDSGYAWTISRNGVVLYSPDPGQVGQSVFEVFRSSPTVTAMAQEAMKGSRGITTYTVSGDPARNGISQKFQAVYLPVTLGNTTWSIVVSTPENEILGTIQGFRNDLIIIFTILIISLFFFTYYLARALGIVREEETRRTAEDALRESEAKYRRIIETANDGVWIIDGAMNTTFVNQRFADMLGYTREEMAGHNVLDYVISEDKGAMDAQFVVRRKGMKSRYECRLRHKDGRTIWCLISGSPILDEANSFRGSFGMVTDITERKKAEAALRESEEFNRSLVENLPDIIAIYDNRGIVRFANQAGLNILGSPLSKVIGEPILSFVAENQREEVQKKMQARLAGEHLAPYEVDIRTGSGGILTAILQAVPISYGKEPVVLLLMTDITARKQAEEKLLEAHRDLEKKVAERTCELSEANLHLQELDRLKSLFIASMSHELRTPLNSIIGFTGIMIKGLAGEINPEQKKQLGMVQDSARHLLALINDVIDISKIEADKIEAGISTFDLADVIRDVRTIYGTTAQDRGLVLVMEIPDPLSVTSDERRIKQIIMNLVSNAIKFTDEGRIDVSVEKKGSVIEVSVRDTGIGIESEDLEQLFRPFGRIAVQGRLTEGTGLGLYLSRKLARFLGGDITAESEPHAGSVFVFSFPVTYRKQEDP
jgi:two-component system, cell cycle sensor histidine kinase and response regulator CckA